MEKDPQRFRGRYRVASSRLVGFDYNSMGIYFVTICTKNREHYFGEVMDGNVKYSALGDIAAFCWKMIPEYFSFVSLGEWIIMPNHVHGILTVVNRGADRGRFRGDAMNGVSTFTDVSPGGITGKYNPMTCKNISTIIRWYKGRVAHEIRKIAPYFSWQSRFYDRIVRNDEELEKVSIYIKNNPTNWEIDELFSVFARESFLMNNVAI